MRALGAKVAFFEVWDLGFQSVLKCLEREPCSLCSVQTNGFK